MGTDRHGGTEVLAVLWGVPREATASTTFCGTDEVVGGAVDAVGSEGGGWLMVPPLRKLVLWPRALETRKVSARVDCLRVVLLP